MGVVIQIFFDNISAAFYPGQQISGKVKISLSSPKQSKGLVVKFKGKAKVSWSEKKSNDKTVTYRAEEDYYEMEFFVWGNGSRQTLNGGEHIFPFFFMLPQNVPGSFESHIGRVKHECSAKLILCEAFDKKTTRLFSVNPIYDLNTDPLSVVPLQATKHKMICCCCCKSGPITLTLNIGQSGFVCGEVMNIFGECSNMSRREINSTHASVYQKVFYMARGHSKTREKLICEARRSSISPGDSDIWSGVRLAIPAVPPSHLPGCSIINIQYELRFSACPSGGLNLSIKKPILIGTIPLRQNFNLIAARPPVIVFPPTAPPPENMNAPPMPPYDPNGAYTSDPPSYLSIYPDCPPPTYADCHTTGDVSSICSDSNDEDEVKDQPFKPQYMCYGFI